MAPLTTTPATQGKAQVLTIYRPDKHKQFIRAALLPPRDSHLSYREALALRLKRGLKAIREHYPLFNKGFW